MLRRDSKRQIETGQNNEYDSTHLELLSRLYKLNEMINENRPAVRSSRKRVKLSDEGTFDEAMSAPLYTSAQVVFVEKNPFPPKRSSVNMP